MSSYAERVTRLLVPTLVRAGLVVVSGLAYGTDATAHRVALQHGGICVVVLGSGFGHIYPALHTGLFNRILASGGCALSEYPYDTRPARYTFPERNRIIAGLSRVLLIIEAGDRSGTLITARQALDCGREVCVVPSDITRQENAGSLQLLREGARPVTSAGDILSLYQTPVPLVVSDVLRPALTGTMASIYDCILRGPIRVDDLALAASLGIVEVQGVLSVLELDGYIECNNENQWQTT